MSSPRALRRRQRGCVQGTEGRRAPVPTDRHGQNARPDTHGADELGAAALRRGCATSLGGNVAPPGKARPSAAGARIWHHPGPMLARFIRQLTETGRVLVGPHDVGEDDADEVHATLLELDALARAEAPEGAPAFELVAAVHGARLLRECARAYLHRELTTESLEVLFEAGPDPRATGSDAAAEAWSLDLCLRYLPGLHTRARRASVNDALVAVMERIAERWPLSGAGVPGVGAGLVGSPAAAALRANGALGRILADRLVAAGAAACLDVPWLARLVDEAVGGYPELLPAWRPRDE